MARGGARPKSGPAPSRNSTRSHLRALEYRMLDARGYQGRPPRFPLPDPIVYDRSIKSKLVVHTPNPEASATRKKREQKLWRLVWTMPQAIIWAEEPWRQFDVAMWVRTFAIAETVDARVSEKTILHRFAENIGLTPAGMDRNMWAIEHKDNSGDNETQQPAGGRARARRAELALVANEDAD